MLGKLVHPNCGNGLVRNGTLVKYLVIGFKNEASDGEAIKVRPFLRSEGGGHIHFADDTEELQNRLEDLGDLRKYEKVIIQEAGELESIGEPDTATSK